MHFIQKHIVDLLRESESKRYSELQPDGVESSHFKYHLNQLIQDEFVEHTSRGVYSLSLKGQAMVDLISKYSVIPAKTPKIISYILLRDSDNYYLQLKPKAPFRETLNLIAGKAHVGESPENAAHRELREKIGFDVDQLELAGVATIRITEEDILVSHMAAFVFVGEYDFRINEQNLVKVKHSELKAIKNLAPDTLELIAAINHHTRPFVIDLDLIN